MKKIILILLVSLSLYSNDFQDSVCFSNTEVQNIVKHINKLEKNDSLQSELINQYELQILKYESLRLNDSLYQSNLNNQIQNMNIIINSQTNQIKKAKKEKYNYFLYGTGAGALLTIILVIGVSS